MFQREHVAGVKVLRWIAKTQDGREMLGIPEQTRCRLKGWCDHDTGSTND